MTSTVAAIGSTVDTFAEDVAVVLDVLEDDLRDEDDADDTMSGSSRR